MFETKTIEPADFPANVEAELQRLHAILVRTADLELSKWAQEKIDQIHRLYFGYTVVQTGEWKEEASQ